MSTRRHQTARLLSALAWGMLGVSGIAGALGSTSPSLATHRVLGPSLSLLVAAAALFGLIAVLQKDTLAEAVWLAVLGGEFLAFGLLAIFDALHKEPHGPLQGSLAIFGLGLLCIAVSVRIRLLSRELTKTLAQLARARAAQAP